MSQRNQNQELGDADIYSVDGSNTLSVAIWTQRYHWLCSHLIWLYHCNPLPPAELLESIEWACRTTSRLIAQTWDLAEFRRTYAPHMMGVSGRGIP